MSEQLADTVVTNVPTLTLLRGHTSPETAYVVEDYPYGRTLRCKRRVWIETPTKGAKKGQQRFVAQTTDPRRPGEVWNKPHGATYSERVYLILDNRTGYVHSYTTHINGPEGVARLHSAGLFAQMNDEEKKEIEMYSRVMERANARWCKPGEFNCWQRHNLLMARISERLAGEPDRMSYDELSAVVGIKHMNDSEGNIAYDSDLLNAYHQVMAQEFGKFLAVPTYQSQE